VRKRRNKLQTVPACPQLLTPTLHGADARQKTKTHPMFNRNTGSKLFNPSVLCAHPCPADLMASTPLFLWDHVAAVVFWVALYGVEVALILSVYARYPDSEQAVSVLLVSVQMGQRSS
jgi:hypothetical protein